jgi:hypothetical protein
MNKREFNRVLLKSALTLGGASIEPALVMASSPPGPPPETLEERIERRAQFILVGTPRRFLYVPDSSYANYSIARRSDLDYKRLNESNASEESYQKYYEQRPVDASAFRLREEGEKIAGLAIAFLEFELERVLFKRGEPSRSQMGILSKRLFFRLGRRLEPDSEYRKAWETYLGKKVILLSAGMRSSRSDTYIPYPYAVHDLIAGNHFLDVLPISLSELSKVSGIAQRFGFVDKP